MKKVDTAKIMQTIVLFMLIMFDVVLMSQNSETFTGQTPTQDPITTNYIDSLNKKAFAEFRTDPAETRRMALKNLSLAKSIDYKTGEGKAYNYIAMSYHITGNYDTSYVYYQKALSLFESENDTLNIGKIYNNLALLFSHREYYNLALEYHLKSLEIAEKLNNTESKFHSYNNIGITYEKLGEYDKAIDSYKMGLQVLSAEHIINDLYYYAMSNIGVINLLTNHSDSARSQITRGLNYFLSVDNNYSISQSYSYLGQLAIELNDYPEAENFLSKSNFYAAKTDDNKLVVTNQFFAAKMLFKRNQLGNARIKFIEVLASAKKGNYVEMEIKSNLHLSKIDSINKNFKEALGFYQAANILKDSINSIKIRNQIAELNIQYQTLQKDKEIELLTTNKEMQELKIKRQLSQRKFLLAVLFGVLSVIIIVVFSHLKIKKKNYLLSLQNEQIAETNKKLLYHQERLEDIVEERTSELTKSKLKAEESDRLKSAFLANMSHEIRTPMNGILGFAELLREPDLSGEQQQKYINIIEKSGARMLNIITNIISISKIESGQMEVNMQETNINEQIEDVFTSFKPEIEGKGIQFLFKNSLHSSQAILKTDREKVYTILSNIVNNAIKYTEKGLIEIGYNKKDGFFDIYVKDTGIGILKDRKEAIFERFIQADISDKMARQGAGLGLSISKAYVEILGGKIWVDSVLGKGSTFYFTIPFEKVLVEDRTIQAKNSMKELKTKLHTKTILITEDDEFSYEYLMTLLNKFAPKVIWVKEGEAAINVCKENPSIDIVLMDIKLPGMDGYEATKVIKAFNPNLPIIAQTAYAVSGDREKAMMSGCNDYCSKPIKGDELLEKMARLL